MKVCNRCKVEKDEVDFRPVARYKNGLFSYCRQCEKENNAEYRRKRGFMPREKREDFKPLPETKICNRCKVLKPTKDFRVRIQEGKYRFLNSTCRKCDADLAGARSAEIRKTPEGRRKNCISAQASYKKRRDKVIAQMRAKRKTPEYKQMMREYRLRNKDKIKEQEIVTKKRYHEKNKNPITDKYAKNLLRTQGNKNPTQEEIEIKKVQVLQKRIRLEILKKTRDGKKND